MFWPGSITDTPPSWLGYQWMVFGDNLALQTRAPKQKKKQREKRAHSLLLTVDSQWSKQGELSILMKNKVVSLHSTALCRNHCDLWLLPRPNCREGKKNTPVCASHAKYPPSHVCARCGSNQGCLLYTDKILKELIPKAMRKYCMGELPSHKFCLFKLSCLIKLIEGIKKASGEHHVHQPVLSSSHSCVTSGPKLPASRAQSIISHYADYHPLVLLFLLFIYKLFTSWIWNNYIMLCVCKRSVAELILRGVLIMTNWNNNSLHKKWFNVFFFCKMSRTEVWTLQKYNWLIYNEGIGNNPWELQDLSISSTNTKFN